MADCVSWCGVRGLGNKTWISQIEKALTTFGELATLMRCTIPVK